MYENNVMPFGLASALGIFKELMSIVLHGLEDFAIAYSNDIIIFRISNEEHKQHIQKTFNCLRQYNFKLKLSNCKFMQKETQYLGFVISDDGIIVDPDYVKVMREILPPTCI